MVNRETPKILIVGDRPANLLVMETILAGADAELFRAESGNEALTLTLHHEFALILLDVQMPGMDGYEVATLLREREATAEIPIVFVTAIDKDDQHAIRGYGTGAVDYLFKPVNADILRSKVNVLLRLFRQQQKLKQANAMLEASLEREKRISDQLETATERMEAASLAKSEFLANMSHEIRTPMTAILGFTESLLDPNLSASERLNAVHTVHRNGGYLLQIINDILDISKIEAGKVEFECIRCSPVELVADAQRLMSVRADQKKLFLAVEYVGAIPETIQTDPTRVRQILVNLIGNAIKFTDTGGVRLVVRLVGVESNGGTQHAESGEAMLQFDVIDTGIGLTTAQQRRLFKAFGQADTSTTRKFGGTGLGLIISNRLATMLGGEVTVFSEAGVGSTFRATIKTGSLDGVKMLTNPAEASTVQPNDSTMSKGETAKLDGRVLLAEDAVDNQRLIKHILNKAGADVTIVENGKLAVEAAVAAGDGDDAFDVILMDMRMPVMDGYEATRLLRQKGYDGPIVALTAHAMASDRQKCIDAGCDNYATKPIDRHKLIEMIRGYTAKDDASRTETGPSEPATYQEASH